MYRIEKSDDKSVWGKQSSHKKLSYKLKLLSNQVPNELFWTYLKRRKMNDIEAIFQPISRTENTGIEIYNYKSENLQVTLQLIPKYSKKLSAALS